MTDVERMWLLRCIVLFLLGIFLGPIILAIFKP